MFEALGGWLGVAAVADAVACHGDAVGCAPPPDDDTVTVPQPAVTATARHAASPLDRNFIWASLSLCRGEADHELRTDSAGQIRSLDVGWSQFGSSRSAEEARGAAVTLTSDFQNNLGTNLCPA